MHGVTGTRLKRCQQKKGWAVSKELNKFRARREARHRFEELNRKRDFREKLSEEIVQLLQDRSGTVNFGFEAVESDHVEQMRYAKIMETAQQFDREAKRIKHICCHYFVTESSPVKAELLMKRRNGVRFVHHSGGSWRKFFS